jgi:hypothetical protein
MQVFLPFFQTGLRNLSGLEESGSQSVYRSACGVSHEQENIEVLELPFVNW